MNRFCSSFLWMIAVVAAILVATGPATTALGDQVKGGGGSGKGRANPPNLGWRGVNTTTPELTADWWQWALNAPAATNPLLDDDGSFCDVGQSGKVWHLAGTFGGDAERWCVVSAGKALFVPIVNNVWVSWPEWHPSPDPPWDEPYVDGDGMEWDSFEDWARAAVAEWIDTFDPETDLYLLIDGVEIPILDEDRVKSPSFMVVFPEGNVFGEPNGVYGPCASDGYWVLLDPLPPGEHTIEFGAEGFLNVVYHLLVLEDD